jgi:hypothetical protein
MMPLMNLSLSLSFEEANHPLVAQVRARLQDLCRARPLHARFLNMLSLLEHIGSRKIMSSQAMDQPDQDLLKHLAEEARHAFFFKRAAERIALRTLDYSAEHTMAALSAQLYMGRLDVEISRRVGTSVTALPYLHMSLIVELRAVWIYRIYQLVLMEQKIALTLKSILAEEELHLNAMLARIQELDREADSRIALFSEIEAIQFHALWAEIQEECSVYRLAAE